MRAERDGWEPTPLNLIPPRCQIIEIGQMSLWFPVNVCGQGCMMPQGLFNVSLYY